MTKSTGERLISHMLAAIVSDCGLVTYCHEYWLELSPTEWDRILEEAREQNLGIRWLLEHFRRARKWASFDAYNKIAHGRYAAMYEWFRGRHTRSSWLGIVPRDILGIVEFYLRGRITINDMESGTVTVTTVVMGILQSFNDKPAYQYTYANRREYRWMQAGQRHRDGGPATLIWHGKDMTCYWSQRDVQVESPPGYSCVMICYNGTVRAKTFHTDWVDVDASCNAEFFDYLRALYVKYDI